MATKADLRDSVLERLGVLGAGATAAQEDAALVERTIDRYHETLVGEGLANWATSDIPDEVMVPLTWIFAGLLARPFELNEQEVVNLENEITLGRNALRRQISVKAKSEPVTAEYF